jgi:hypothetical protein
LIHSRKGASTPCDKCLPVLYPENVQAIKIFQQVSAQLIYTPKGKPIDLNLGTLDRVLTRYGIESTEVFEKVAIAVRHMIREK